MSNSALAQRYAKAIFDLAEDGNAIDTVAQDFNALKELLAESANLREAVQNPVISRFEQKNAMEFILKKVKVNPLTERFVAVLIDNGRLSYLAEVADAYAEKLKSHKGEMTATVTSATPLAKAQVIEIGASLGKALNKKVHVEEHVDENILGGLVVQIGSKMLDASVAGGLDNLKLQCKTAMASS